MGLEQCILAALKLLCDGTVEVVLYPSAHSMVAEEVREQPMRDARSVGEHTPHEYLERTALGESPGGILDAVKEHIIAFPGFEMSRRSSAPRVARPASLNLMTRLQIRR